MRPARIIRPSSLTSAQDCMRRFAARHLAADVKDAGFDLQPASPTGVGAAVGSGVHEGAKVTMLAKAKDGLLGTDKDAEDAAVTMFEERLSTEGARWDATTPTVSTGQRQVQRMTRAYRRHVAPGLAPLVTEERFEADIGDGWGVSGQIDTLGGDPHEELHDTKTGVRRRMNAVQYVMYISLLNAHGYTVDKIVEDYIKRVPLKKEQPEPIPYAIPLEPARAEAWSVIEDIKRSTALFEQRVAATSGPPPETAFRANPASQLCSANWCPAHGTSFCRAHIR